MPLTGIYLLYFIFFWYPKEPVIADGYVNRLSVFPGDSVTIYLNAYQRQEKYAVKLYDLQGNVVAKYYATVFPQERNPTEPWKNGFGYKPTLRVAVPKLKSGVYLFDDQVPIVVKSKQPKIVIVYSSNTENAYCSSGGKSLYSYNSSDKQPASIVSFLRPINLPKHSEAFLRWIGKQGLSDIGYMADNDLDKFDEWKNARLLMIVGHSEYWTLQARQNFDRFVEEGKNALILSGNTMWWQVRYDHKHNQLICYKSEADPEPSPKLKTITWDSPSLNYAITSSIGADFPRAGYGLKQDKGWDGYRIVNPKSPLLKGVRTKKGNVIPLATDEYDGTPIVGFSGSYNPVADKNFLGFEKIEIVGYDSTSRDKDGLATWIVFKKHRKSGIVINTASTDWCSQRGMGTAEIKKITLTMISLLYKNENVFSE